MPRWANDAITTLIVTRTNCLKQRDEFTRTRERTAHLQSHRRALSLMRAAVATHSRLQRPRHRGTFALPPRTAFVNLSKESVMNEHDELVDLGDASTETRERKPGDQFDALIQEGYVDAVL